MKKLWGKPEQFSFSFQSMKLSYSIYEADWLSAKLSTRKKMILDYDENDKNQFM
jgi:hypothetical protein